MRAAKPRLERLGFCGFRIFRREFMRIATLKSVDVRDGLIRALPGVAIDFLKALPPTVEGGIVGNSPRRACL